MNTQDIQLSHIFTRKDARAVDDAAMRRLADSIAEIGIINPLRVRPARRNVDGVEADAYEVTAGAHRLRAARKVGLTVAPCIVVDDDDLHAELAMIDENLMRAELGAADRAAQIARRKAIYEELHPETTHGAIGNGREKIRQVGDSTSDRFTADTAKATGKSERSIQREAERGEKVTEQALMLVRGTELDTGSYLDRLKKVDADKQIETVQRALKGIAEREANERACSDAKRSQARIDADVKQRAARMIAEIIVENIHADALDGLRANLAATTNKHILTELANLLGASIMDRRYEAAE